MLTVRSTYLTSFVLIKQEEAFEEALTLSSFFVYISHDLDPKALRYSFFEVIIHYTVCAFIMNISHNQ